MGIIFSRAPRTEYDCGGCQETNNRDEARPASACVWCDGSRPYDKFEPHRGFYGSDGDWWPGNYCPACGRQLIKEEANGKD